MTSKNPGIYKHNFYCCLHCSSQGCDCYHVWKYHLHSTGYVKAFWKVPWNGMFHSAKETDVKGTSLHRGHRWDLRAPPEREDGHTERKGGEQHPPGAAKYSSPSVAAQWTNKLVSGRSTDLHPCGFEMVFGFLLCPQFQHLCPLSMCSHTPRCLQARSSSQGRIQKCCSQVRELWFRCLNCETGCPDSLFLFCRGLVSLWIPFYYFFLSIAFFKCVFRFGFHRKLTMSQQLQVIKAHTSVRRKNVDNLTILWKTGMICN